MRGELADPCRRDRRAAREYFESARRTWRLPVRGGLVVRDDAQMMIDMAERGLGITYTFEPMVAEQLRSGRLKLVLEPYAATVPGFFIYFPSRAQRSGPLRSFLDTAKEIARRRLT